MECLVCNYIGEFGNIEVSSTNGSASAIGRMPVSHESLKRDYDHVGSVSILVCPNCGALHSTMRNKIKLHYRKDS